MMSRRLGRSQFFAVTTGFLFFTTAAQSIESGRDRVVRPEATDVKNQALMSSTETDPNTPRVRIKLTLVEYEALEIKNELGISRIEHRAVRTVRQTLRARIERGNHFYVGNWHIETLPISHSRESLKYAAGLRFAKKYGRDWDMEEYVGRIDVNGSLAGKDNSYELIGGNTAKFFSPDGQPLLTVEVGTNPLKTPIVKQSSPEDKGSIAQQEPKIAPTENKSQQR